MGFYKLSCMSRVHQEACSSIPSPFHWPSSTGYFYLFVWSFFLATSLWVVVVATLCLARSSLRKALMVLSMKWDPHRLPPSLVFQSEGRSLHGTFFLHAWHRQLYTTILLPTLTCNQPQRGCTRSLETFGMAPWSQCPTHQIFLFEDCSGGALHCERWCLLPAGISDTIERILWYLHTSSARRIRTARFWLECGMLHSGLRTELHGIFWWFVSSLPQACTFLIGHQHIPCRGTGRPKGDVCF